MKIELIDIGLKLIPETDKEQHIIKRFWDGGIKLNSFESAGTIITISFGDLVQKKTTKRYSRTYTLERNKEWRD